MSSSSERSFVRTVRGDIPASELGHTQCHEHIFLENGPAFEANPALCIDDMTRSLAELREYFAGGGRTIVDAQPVFCGRNAHALLKLSEESCVNIVAVTGFHKKMFWETDTPVYKMTQEKIADLYAKEITDGMTAQGGLRSSARAGLVKVAFDKGGLEDAQYGKLFAAAAEAAKATGAPVLVHTEKDTDLFELLRFFEKAEVSASRLIICHLDRTRYDARYHREILSTGCFLCYDSVNRLKYVSEEQELELITAMRDAGFIRQLVISLDTTNERLRAYNAKDMGLDYILKNYIPLLLERGFSEEEIRYMCQTNAQSALSMK